MADDYKVQIGIDADDGKLSDIENRLNSLPKRKSVTLVINTQSINGQLASIEKRLKAIGSYQINPFGGGSGNNNGGNGGTGRKKRDDPVRDAYENAMYYQRKINSVNAKIAKANANTDILGKDTLETQLSEYQVLLNEALKQQNNFTKKQKDRFNRLKDEGAKNKSLIKSNLQDKTLNGVLSDIDKQRSQVERIRKLLDNGSVDNKISDLVSRKNKIGSSNATIDKAFGDGVNGGDIKETRERLRKAFEDKSAFENAGMKSVIDDFEKLNDSMTLADNNLKELKRESQKVKVSAKSPFDKLKSDYSSKKIENGFQKVNDRFTKSGGERTASDDLIKTIDDLSKAKTNLDRCFNKDGTLTWGTTEQQALENYKKYTELLDKAANLTEIQARENPLEGSKVNVARRTREMAISGDLSSEVDALERKFQSLDVESQSITSNIGELRTCVENIKGSSDIDDLVENTKKYNDLLKQTKTDVNNIKEGQDISYKRNTMLNGIDSYLNKNTAAVKKYGEAFAELKTQIENATDVASLDRLNKKVTELKSEIKKDGLEGLSFGDQIKNSIQKILPALTAADIVKRGVDTVKQMAQETMSVDKAMTELRRVTNLSESEYDKLYSKMTQSAKAYGAELDTMINSTASWVRLGFSADDANKLAEVSTMYQHVTDLDEGTAVKNLVTAYQGYKKQLLEATGGDQVAAVEKVADIFDKLGNELPVTAAQVGAGMNKWASVAQSAGATIEEAAAMTVGGGSVTQDFEQTGSALKIATLRIQGMKGKLEELGEEVDGNVESVSKMQTQILNLTNGEVNIFEDDGKSFRNIFEIFRDIAEVLPKLDDASRSQLLETVAGKNRSNSILAMLQNWDEVEKALTAANNAEGTARDENAIYMDSIQGKIDSLKASWQALSNTVVNSDFLKMGLDVVNAIVNVLDTIIGKIGSITSLFVGGGIVKTVKSIS